MNGASAGEQSAVSNNNNEVCTKRKISETENEKSGTEEGLDAKRTCLENAHLSSNNSSSNQICSAFTAVKVPPTSVEHEHSKNCNRKRKWIKSNDKSSSKQKNMKFLYGNYHKYYGYRNPNKQDERLSHFKREWFEGKEVLDIGCNAGFVTLQIARDFGPKKITGIDIDTHLIGVARKNIKNFHKLENSSKLYPANVKFVAGNYVLEDDVLLENIQPEYDIVLCLSVTKWIHLNWGDSGLKRVFRRIFAQLRPAGKFVLEAQNWTSYERRKTLSDQIKKNYSTIQLYPEKFTEFLLRDVGFSSCETIAVPNHSSKGFQRPIQVFVKAVENATVVSDTSHPISQPAS